jgi:TRAP-type C4-dicarboxylate transport system permease small subunit
MTATRRIPVPFIFIAVVALVVALIIFFGAWAVSADVGNQRTLAFGLPGTTISSGNVQEGDSGPYHIARLDGNGAASETWWGGAFLRACPLH